MCKVGFPGNLDDGLMKLYDQTSWADGELKKDYSSWPSFLQYSPPKTDQQQQQGTPNPSASTKHLASIALLSTAHKASNNNTGSSLNAENNHQIFTVHRHFQLRSFRDRRFAYTQVISAFDENYQPCFNLLIAGFVSCLVSPSLREVYA